MRITGKVGFSVKSMLGKALSGQKRSEKAENRICPGFVVRLVEPIPRAPATPFERLVVAHLRPEGSLAFELLAERMAWHFYNEELRHGAWVVDLGLFGNRLFVPEVVAEIKRGNGILWIIEKTKPDRASSGS